MQLEKEEIEDLIKQKVETGINKYGKEFKILVLEIVNLEKMIMPENTAKQKKLIPLPRWNDVHPYPSVRAMRQYYFNRKKNGFEDCVEYGGENGGRILIDEEKFFLWQGSRKKIKNTN